MQIQSSGMGHFISIQKTEYNTDIKHDVHHYQRQESVDFSTSKSNLYEYNFRSMTESERINFANEAVSAGVISLKEAGAFLPPRVQRVDGANGFEIKEKAYPKHHRFDVIEELTSSINFSKENGGSKGLEIRESLLFKLEHLTQGVSIDLKA